MSHTTKLKPLLLKITLRRRARMFSCCYSLCFSRLTGHTACIVNEKLSRAGLWDDAVPERLTRMSVMPCLPMEQNCKYGEEKQVSSFIVLLSYGD